MPGVLNNSRSVCQGLGEVTEVREAGDEGRQVVGIRAYRALKFLTRAEASGRFVHGNNMV